MSGSAADTGLDYQAQATAFVAVCALAGQPLDWFDDLPDVPIAVSAESGGAGDDICIDLVGGDVIETQVKHGLDKDSRFWSAIDRLAKGLTTELGLRGVLLVDNTSSRTISPAFQNDLLRGGRSDREKAITGEVREFLKEKGFAPDDIFPRLRIVQNDFAMGSSGTGAAHALLRQVVASPVDVATAWRILVDDAHKLIKHRGRRDAASLARLLARHVALTQQSHTPAIVAQNYCVWLAKKTATYYVPGLGVSLPIDSSWIELQVLEDNQDRRPVKTSLEKMVRDYHEWERLADDYTNLNRLDVEYLHEFANRCVVLGGPGSGKSTLARRLGNQLGKQGRVALVVRLKILARLLDNGKPFDEALVLAATEGLGLPPDALRRALAHPEYLVADGLDECDPERAEVAERLRSWCDGHAPCRVIVTTRPIGHDPGILPGFEHYELLPLEGRAIREHSLRLFEAFGRDGAHDEAHCAEQWERFIDGLEEETKDLDKKVRTLAARNPLLLGFLVRLHIDGLDTARNRSVLLTQIVQLMEKTNDPTQQLRPVVPSHVAHACLDTIGWHLIESPSSGVDRLLTKIGSDLADKCQLGDSPGLARAALRFWESSRAIERLTAGHLEAVVFVHPVLGEFAAARHVLGVAPPLFDAWMRRVRRQPRWYQTILLAAGIDRQDRVVRALLKLDDPLDPCSTEAKTAASALADGATVSDAIRSRVVDALTDRLTSPIPVVSVESALSLMPVARFAADLVAMAVAKLRHHEQEWTRLAALSLSTACGKGILDDFEQWFRTFELPGDVEIGGVSNFARFCRRTSPVMPEEAIEMYHQVVKTGVQRMIVEQPRAHVEQFFDTLEHTDGLSVRMLSDIEDALRKGGFSKQAKTIRDRHWESDKEHMERGLRASKREREVLLNCVLDACGVGKPVPAEVSQDRFPLVRALVQAMRFGECYASDSVYIRRAVDCEAITEAMKGVVAALGLDVIEVASEAATALRRNDDGFTLSFLLPKVPNDPNWSQAANAGLSPDLLERAIRHPHPSVAYTATMLVDAGAAGAATEQLVLNLLDDGAAQVLRFAAPLAISAFGERCAQVIWDRLGRGISAGCQHLVRVLIEHASQEKRPELLSDIPCWLCHSGSRFAAGVADSLDRFSPPVDTAIVPQLRRAYVHWDQQGSWCDEHGIQTDTESCRECNIVLPSVKAAILRQLIKLQAVPVEELVELLSDNHSEVNRIATSALMSMAAERADIVGMLLDKISGKQLSLSLLDRLSALPVQVLRENEPRFTSLLSSTEESIRCAALRHVIGQWIPREKAISYTRKALQDVVPAVRTQAARTLRSIENVEQ